MWRTTRSGGPANGYGSGRRAARAACWPGGRPTWHGCGNTNSQSGALTRRWRGGGFALAPLSLLAARERSCDPGTLIICSEWLRAGAGQVTRCCVPDPDSGSFSALLQSMTKCCTDADPVLWRNFDESTRRSWWHPPECALAGPPGRLRSPTHEQTAPDAGQVPCLRAVVDTLCEPG